MLRAQAFAKLFLASNMGDITITALVEPWAKEYIRDGWVAPAPEGGWYLTDYGAEIIKEFAPRAVGRPPIPAEERERREAAKREARERREAAKREAKAQREADAVVTTAVAGRALYGREWLTRVIERLAAT